MGRKRSKSSKLSKRPAKKNRASSAPSTPDKTHIGQKYRVDCKYFAYGKCRLGDDCPFAHVQAKFKTEADYCKFFIGGKCDQTPCSFSHDIPCQHIFEGRECPFGRACRFSHAILSESQRSKHLETMQKESTESEPELVKIVNPFPKETTPLTNVFLQTFPSPSKRSLSKLRSSHPLEFIASFAEDVLR